MKIAANEIIPPSHLAPQGESGSRGTVADELVPVGECAFAVDLATASPDVSVVAGERG